MKTRKQLLRELKKVEAKICEMQITIEELKQKEGAARQMATNNDEIVRRQEKVIQQLRNESHDLRDKWYTALVDEKNASARAAQLMHINDVLCAELQDCDRCIDTVRMALEQKSAHAELLNRITVPLV